MRRTDLRMRALVINIERGRNSRIVLGVVLFLYVFAFYLGPFSVSILMCIPLYGMAFFNRPYARCIKQVIQCRFICKVLQLWMVIVFLGLLYPTILFTFDYSFFKVIATQGIHYFAAMPVLAYLSYKSYTSKDVERTFVLIFVVQTFIQFIVLFSPSLKEAILAFNHYEPDKVIGIGDNIRGVALSAATTYHLTLAYGIAFIIYCKYYLSRTVNFKTIFIGISIFCGIFCAGRSGFVGCTVGLAGWFLNLFQKGFSRRVKTIFKVTAITAILVIVLLSCIETFYSEAYRILERNVFPYAFESFYSQSKSGQFETTSTNQLMEMWNSDFNPMELLLGAGIYTEPGGGYYMHVDPGILRHLLFFGIFGYIILLIYQYALIPLKRFRQDARYYMGLVFVFLLLLDFKGVTVGLNKFMVFISLLLSYSYLYLPDQDTGDV